MTDQTVNAGRDERVAGLNGNKSAEAAAEHEHGPEPERPARSKQRNAEPAHGIAVESPKIVAVRTSRKIGRNEPGQRKGCNHPAVRAVFADAGAHVAARQ